VLRVDVISLIKRDCELLLMIQYVLRR